LEEEAEEVKELSASEVEEEMEEIPELGGGVAPVQLDGGECVDGGQPWHLVNCRVYFPHQVRRELLPKLLPR
jgi:hypothetical protein